MSDRLDLQLSDDGDDTTVTVRGELDLTTVEALEHQAGAALDQGRSVTVDLGGLTFIDSTGLSALVSLHQRAADHGGGFRLSNVPDHARRLLQITKMDDLLAP